MNAGLLRIWRMRIWQAFRCCRIGKMQITPGSFWTDIVNAIACPPVRTKVAARMPVPSFIVRPLLRSKHLQNLRGDARHDGTRRHVLRHNGTGRDDRAIPYTDTCQKQNVFPDPDIVSYGDGVILLIDIPGLLKELFIREDKARLFGRRENAGCVETNPFIG